MKKTSAEATHLRLPVPPTPAVIPTIHIEEPPHLPVQAPEVPRKNIGDLEELDGLHVILHRPRASATSQESVENEGQAPISATPSTAAAREGRDRDRGTGKRRRRRWIRVTKCRRQLYTIFWTNLLMRYRMKIVSLFELLLPVLVIWGCIAALTSGHNWQAMERVKSDLSSSSSSSSWLPISEAQVQAYFCNAERLCAHRRVFLVYTPDTPFTRRLMRNVATKLGLVGVDPNRPNDVDALLGVDSPSELIALCKAQHVKSESDPEIPDPVGLIFSERGDEIHFSPPGFEYTPGGIPTALSYTIRTFLPEIANTLDLYPYLDGGGGKGTDGLSPYITTGFAGLQSAIDTSYTEMLAAELGEVPLVDLSIAKPSLLVHLSEEMRLQSYPSRVYLDLKVRRSTWGAVMVAFVLGYFCTTYFTLNRLILHRSAGILKMLKLHGMGSALHWLSLLFYEILFHAITCGGVTWILFASSGVGGAGADGLLHYDDPGLVFFFLCMHGLAIFCFYLLISAFFTKTILGSLVGFLISFLSYFIPMNLYLYGYLHHQALNVFLCLLFPNWTLANGIYQFLKYESYDSAADWSSSGLLNWTDSSSTRLLLLPIGWCLVILFLSALLYFCLTLAWDNWDELRERCVRLLQKKKKHAEAEAEDQQQHPFEKPAVYEEDEINPCHVRLQNVTVAFGQDTIALDSISMNFHQGQLTVLLGLNHAGKSTLLNVVAGLQRPTSGSVAVEGRVGFCPKKLSLFPSLSVEEHIRLCCMLHGNSIRYSKATTAALLRTFNLWEARRMGVKYISAAQLRRLGLAMAMSNNCAVLVLEEPTGAGMSDSERHEIWSALQYLKKNRTIIVSLGSLDDGDAYADRLVLLSRGRVVCAGSPSFLARSYNMGSFLKVHKAAEEVNVDQITFFVQILFPGLAAAAASAEGGGLHEVRMGGNEEQEHYMYLSIPPALKFSKVLQTLEEFEDELGIADVRVLHNTLAAIFYKLEAGGGASNSEIGVFRQKRESFSTSADFEASEAEAPSSLDVPTLPEGVNSSPSACGRLQALALRHFQHARQKHWNFLGEFVVSFILVAVFMYFCESWLHLQPESTSRALGFGTYPRGRVPVRLLVTPEGDSLAWINAFRYVAFGGAQERLVFYNSSRQDQDVFQALLRPPQGPAKGFQSQISTAYTVSFTHDNNIASYAAPARHAAPAALNTFKNVLLYLLTPATLRDAGGAYRITASAHPFVVHNGTGTPTGTVDDVTNALAGILFALALAFIAGARIELPHLERASGLKYLLQMGGVRAAEYWTALWGCDALIGLLGSCILLAIVWAMDGVAGGVFGDWESRGVLFVICALYLCWSALPFAYLFSFLVRNPHSGYGQWVMLHILTGSVPALLTYLVTPSARSRWVRYAFQVFPPFTVSSAFVLLCEAVSQRHFCRRASKESLHTCAAYEESLKWSGGASSHYKHYANISVDQNDVYFQKCCTAYCSRGQAPSCVKTAGLLHHEPGAFDLWFNVLCMVGQGLGFWILLALLELCTSSGWLWKPSRGGNGAHKAKTGRKGPKKDADVLQEEGRVENALESRLMATDCLIVSELTSKSKKRSTALDHISFKMIAGTILGVLGPSECGKAELVQALVGRLRYTQGSVILNRVPLEGRGGAGQRRRYLQQLGYAPALPALLPYLTGLQMMELMGRIRGLPSEYLTIHSKKWLQLLRIRETTQALHCRHLNSGRQKRLSFCMALIGLDPRALLLLDEPTQLLDVSESLLLWNLLTHLRKQGQSVLFTSSSAEECAQLATKLVCLVGGSVSAVGPPKHIFERYPRGWSLMIRLFHDIGVKFVKEDVERMTEALVSYVLRVFRPCELTDQREHLLFFYVQGGGGATEGSPRPLSFFYGQMEEVKDGMPDFIDDYYIEEASLDDLLSSPPPARAPSPAAAAALEDPGSLPNSKSK